MTGSTPLGDRLLPPCLDAGLLTVLDGVSVSPDGLSATVGGRELTAETGRQLRQKLIAAIYETFHVGHVFGEDLPRSFRDPALEERLAGRTPHATTPVRAVPYRPEDAGGPRIAVIDGIKVRLTPSETLVDGQVRLPAHRPGLSPGFFLVDGSSGKPLGKPLLRLYLQLDGVDEAVDLWGTVLERMEAAKVRYRAKVTSSPRLFPRRDGLVVYLGEDAWDAVLSFAYALQPSSKAGRSGLSSPFARELAPGVAIAWEPDDSRPGRRGMSFGQHRAAAIVDALLEPLGAPVGNSGTPSDECLVRHLREAGIDPVSMHRNAESPMLSG
ncbi:T3SS effector HopA1 family protein [Streptomyces sp. NPDC088400]|uniref:T3SS effector HopA1 family protein n=1 Tax=Streptomyces sp. NPDC088400 TaxID=3365861 RepID=UPI0038269E0A